MNRTRVGALSLTVSVVLLAAFASASAGDRGVAELTSRWAPPPSRFIPVVGMQVHLRDEGPHDDTRPLLLLHGTSSSLHTRDGLARSLTRSRRVVRIDVPASGLTGPFPDSDDLSRHYNRSLVELLDSLNFPRASSTAAPSTSLRP